jgi:hypothetical protein
VDYVKNRGKKIKHCHRNTKVHLFGTVAEQKSVVMLTSP